MSKINLTKVAGNYDMRLAGSSTFDVLGLVLTLECPTDDSRSCQGLRSFYIAHARVIAGIYRIA